MGGLDAFLLYTPYGNACNIFAALTFGAQREILQF
jgi:hypothetical protein